MFCPSCKAEYVEGIVECADCHVPLVDKLPDEEEKGYHEPDDGQANYVRLTTLVNLNDILLIQSIFDSENIYYHLRGWNFFLNRLAAEEVVLFVREDQVEDAMNLIQDLEISAFRFSTNTEGERDSPIRSG